jgi:hypothetical protein
VLQRQEAVLAGSGKEIATLKGRIAALDRQLHVLQLKSSGPSTPGSALCPTAHLIGAFLPRLVAAALHFILENL